MRRSLVEQTRVIVTGGRGFVGSALLTRAQRAGYRVASFDLQDGLDICDPSALRAAIQPGDTVVHLAAYADLYVAREHPSDCVRVNVLGTTLVAETTRQCGARLVLGSTLCVYGNQPNYPTHEDTRPNPSEIYAQTKLAAEQVVQGMIDTLGLQATIVRFPGVYGPGMRDSLAVARFMRAASEGDDLLVHGDGAQTRTPMHVDDVADGLLAVVQHERCSRVINLAATEEISALELARRIIRLAGRGTIRHTAQRSPQTLREFADGSLAARELDWRPQHTLDEGLASTWEWWQGQQGIATG